MPLHTPARAVVPALLNQVAVAAALTLASSAARAGLVSFAKSALVGSTVIYLTTSSSRQLVGTAFSLHTSPTSLLAPVLIGNKIFPG